MTVKVKLRTKSISDARQSLYLDFYPYIENPATGERTRREFLGLYIFDKPKTVTDKKHNLDTLNTAESMRQKRDNELNKPEIYTEFEKKQLKQKEISERSFLKYFKQLADERKKSNHDNWVSCYNYLMKFTDESLYFGELNEKFCNDFKRFLLNARSFRSEKSKLSQNSALSYYNKFKAALNQAFADGFIQSDLTRKIEGIKPVEIRRNFLTMEELNKLAKCETDHKLMKRAALFSALTGLRYSDIEKLKWKEVEVIEGEGYFLNFKQQKTKGIEVLPISEQAFQLMGVKRNPDEKVFQGLSDRDRYYHFPVWVAQAGITKEVTFHCLRHTFATLQLTKGTDIYTVSKLLGHRELKTTQVYAKIIDQTKRDAVNRITIEL